MRTCAADGEAELALISTRAHRASFKGTDPRIGSYSYDNVSGRRSAGLAALGVAMYICDLATDYVKATNRRAARGSRRSSSKACRGVDLTPGDMILRWMDENAGDARSSAKCWRTAAVET